jgi:putative endonuclease
VPYYVYIILCKDDSYYTGYTSDLDSRIRLHLNGKGARYTKMHRPEKLVYVETFASRTEAMRREKKVKRLDHGQKFELVNSRNRKRQKRKGEKGY